MIAEPDVKYFEFLDETRDFMTCIVGVMILAQRYVDLALSRPHPYTVHFDKTIRIEVLAGENICIEENQR